MLEAGAIIDLVAGQASPLPDPAQVAALVDRVRRDPDLLATLPAFPASSARVLEMVERPNLDLNELIRVLHWDAAAANEILRMANAAGFSRGRVDDLREAVFTLGLGEVGAIAAAVGARTLFSDDARAEHAAFERMWGALHHDALVAAFTAAWLGQALHLPRYDRIFLRAVLGSCGRPLALRVIARQLVDGRCPTRPPPQVVLAALDELSDDVRDMALYHWQLPSSLVDIAAPGGQLERAVVELVQGVALLRRAPHLLTVAERVRGHAATLRLDAAWLRVLTRELDDADTRVGMMFGTKRITVSAANIPALRPRERGRA
jgi:HD-like signal output (HDOD) protein